MAIAQQPLTAVFFICTTLNTNIKLHLIFLELQYDRDGQITLFSTRGIRNRNVVANIPKIKQPSLALTFAGMVLTTSEALTAYPGINMQTNRKDEMLNSLSVFFLQCDFLRPSSSMSNAFNIFN